MNPRWKAVMAVTAAVAGIAWGLVLVLISQATTASAATWDGVLAIVPRGYVDRNFVGRPDAPVQIVIYGSFECGFCNRLHQEVELPLMERYVTTGRVRLESRQLGTSATSVRATGAALCAADQGRYWEYRDRLYAAYRKGGQSALADESLKQIATQLGLDQARFEECLNVGTPADEIRLTMLKAKDDGIQGLPTMFINDRKVEGLRPLDDVTKVVEEELTK